MEELFMDTNQYGTLDIPKYFEKEYGISSIDELQRQIEAAPSIAMCGGSGSGKSTALLELLPDLLAKLLRTNIRSIQSSKIRNQIIAMNAQNKDIIMAINFARIPNYDIFSSNLLKIVSEAITSNRADIEKIINKINDIIENAITPDTKAFDLHTVFGNEDIDLKDSLQQIILNLCKALIDENGKHLATAIKEKKAECKTGKDFNINEAYKSEINKRLNKVDLKDINLLVDKIAERIKRSVMDLIHALGIPEHTSCLDNTYYIIVETTNLDIHKKIYEFLKILYSSSGKDFIISHISYYAPMSEVVSEIFTKVFGKNRFAKQNRPIFSINDLKGLETGEGSVAETISTVRQVNPDTLLVFHRTKDVSEFYHSLMIEAKSSLPSLCINGVFTFADQTMLDYMREDFLGFDGPGTPLDTASDYFEVAVKSAYEQLTANISQYKKRLSKTEYDNYLLRSSIPCNELTSIDCYLEKNKSPKLYCPEQFTTYVAKICKSIRSKYKEIEVELDDVKIEIKETLLVELSKYCVDQHLKRCEDEYLQFLHFNVHWNTVYKWRSMHRIGSGWQSSAKVYDNINIYIGPMCKSFISTKQILDLLSVYYESNVSHSKKDEIHRALTDNFNQDMNRLKLDLATELSYESMSVEFSQTYFVGALQLIYKNLTSEKYWYDAIKKTLSRHIEIEKIKTLN